MISKDHNTKKMMVKYLQEIIHLKQHPNQEYNCSIAESLYTAEDLDCGEVIPSYILEGALIISTIPILKILSNTGRIVYFTSKETIKWTKDKFGNKLAIFKPYEEFKKLQNFKFKDHESGHWNGHTL